MTDDDAFSIEDDTWRAPHPAPRRAFAQPATNGMLRGSMRTIVRVLGIRSRCAALTLGVALQACSVVPPNDADGGGGFHRTPGEPFLENVCFQCTLRACSVPVRACARDTLCSRWFDCVAMCPTDDSGVAAEGNCLRKCGLPVSANVLFECIQDFSTGSLRGCEQACAP